MHIGRSYLISSQRTLLQCLESLVQKIQIGVVVNLEKVISEGIKKITQVKESDGILVSEFDGTYRWVLTDLYY